MRDSTKRASGKIRQIAGYRAISCPKSGKAVPQDGQGGTKEKHAKPPPLTAVPAYPEREAVEGYWKEALNLQPIARVFRLAPQQAIENEPDPRKAS